MTIQNNNNNLNYLIDPTFANVNRLFVLSFERIEEDNIKKYYRDSFSHYYCTKRTNKRLQCLNRWQKFFRFANKKQRRSL